MHVWVRFEVLAGRIGCDVSELVIEVLRVAHAVLEVARMPNGLPALDGMRVTAFNELNAAGSALVDRRRDEDMDVVGHRHETVKQKLAAIAITEERCDEEAGISGVREVRSFLECRDCDGVGAQLVAGRRHEEKHTPGAKAPFALSMAWPSLKAWRT